MDTCYIFGAGDLDKKEQSFWTGLQAHTDSQDCIIAADGGLHYLQFFSVKPDYIIGDFDSSDHVPGEGEADRGIVRLPREKDLTDIHAAINLGIELGYKRFEIYGALGGARLDHSIGNMQLATAMVQKGYEASFYGNGVCLMAIRDGMTYSGIGSSKGEIISVFSITERSEGVNISGLKYNLQEAQLTQEFPLGISNETLPGQKFHITVAKGVLVIVHQR